MNNESENSTLLTDRQLLELLLKKVDSMENRLSSIENEQTSVKDEQRSMRDEQRSMRDTMNMHFENFNQRLLQLEVQTETLTSLAYQALSVAHAVKADVRALREESASHGRDISELQTKMLEAA